MVKLTMSKKQSKFREEYKNSIAPWYSGWAHLLSIFIPGLLVIGFLFDTNSRPKHVGNLYSGAAILVF